MKELKKTSIIILFIFLSLPIPFSLISWIGTIISIADIGMTKLSTFGDYIQTLVVLITMLIAGAYLITYVVSLKATLKNKKFTLISFLPILHIILCVIFLFAWQWLNIIYKG